MAMPLRILLGTNRLNSRICFFPSASLLLVLCCAVCVVILLFVACTSRATFSDGTLLGLRRVLIGRGPSAFASDALPFQPTVASVF